MTYRILETRCLIVVVRGIVSPLPQGIIAIFLVSLSNVFPLHNYNVMIFV